MVILLILVSVQKHNRLKLFSLPSSQYASTGRRFKGKGKGNKAAQPGSKGKVQFQGKKTKFDSDDDRDENGAAGNFFLSPLEVP